MAGAGLRNCYFCKDNLMLSVDCARLKLCEKIYFRTVFDNANSVFDSGRNMKNSDKGSVLKFSVLRPGDGCG